ncbi:hypothetical protein EYB53_016600 [Candidatus Chloroploca sp. M-50]|uniref:Uncharacterized protein n=1 Tax=Candidatus Chloroploca mongolica TaxID=2528176 RepID=A0ABS4DD10_9CHLR|nr:hypothetical protein [Candidatus Chloroploca mongolica]MBP1467334.1 hypothetical protein [Candidatus Chloroploca mongolica]
MPTVTQLCIPMTTTPVAALLAAAGVARWFADALRDITGDGGDVRIANAGHSIIVSTARVVSREQLRQVPYRDPTMRWIQTDKTGSPPADLPVLDYEAEKRHNSDYYQELERYRKLKINVKTLPSDERNALEQKAPRPYWPVAVKINQMSALNAYNKAVEAWAACRPIYPELIDLIWTLFSGKPGAIEQAQEAWVQLAKTHGLEHKALLSATQVVNPEQGKGANRAKADALTIGGRESFWLLEYFKFAGLFDAALPRTVQSKKDRKTYIVIPSAEGIELHWHDTIFKQFQQQFWAGTAIKMDIQAALRYTDAMLAQWEGAMLSSGRQRKPSDLIQGFAVVAYKDLGSAFAVMNVSTINLPDWIAAPEEVSAIQHWRDEVDQHQRIIGALEEKFSEEEHLLRHYRDFLSSRDPNLTAFFAFTTGYASHVMSKMSKRQPVRRFTINTLEVIIMANDNRREKPLAPILETQGFRNIATAIRRSTVIPQYQKTKGDTPYDVRYGLADDLRRKARNNAEFMRALSEFMQQYNQENKRIFAREKRPVRADITTGDITDIVNLIDEYDAPTVANLLIAYGYARDPKTPDAVHEESDAATSEPELTSEEPTAETHENQPF